MGHALSQGFRRLARSAGLVPLLLLVNLGSAALLAVPLARTLESDLQHKDAAREMMHGFDFPWWSQWSDAQRGWTASFAPDGGIRAVSQSITVYSVMKWKASAFSPAIAMAIILTQKMMFVT